MAKKLDGKIIIVRMEHVDVSAMYKLYNDLKKSWIADRDNPHELLLKEHIKTLAIKWQKLYEDNNDSYNVKLSTAEAMAFMQTWCDRLLLFDDFTNHTLQNIIFQIHKQAADLRVKALISYEK